MAVLKLTVNSDKKHLVAVWYKFLCKLCGIVTFHLKSTFSQLLVNELNQINFI